MWPDEVRPWYGSFVHSQARSLEESGVELETLVIRGYASRWAYARGALRSLATNLDRRIDLVHAHYGHSAVLARLIVSAPLVVSYCGDDLLGTPDPDDPGRPTPSSRALAAAFAQLARLAAATITKSEAMEEKLPAACRERNHVIPNGVDLEHFRPTDQLEARRALGWPEEEKVALFAGNPELARKNFALAQVACAHAARTCDSLRLRVAWGLSPEQMPIWMNAADALIFTSLSEGSPNVVKEAMACDLPVVSTPVGDVPERLRGVPGSAVVSPSPEGLGAALVTALSHGRSGTTREAVLELGAQRIAERVIGVYESVLRRKALSANPT